MDRRSYLSSVASVSILPLSAFGKNESEFYETREIARCVFGDEEYVTGIRFYKLEPPLFVTTSDIDESTHCVYTCVHEDYFGVGTRLDPPTEFWFDEYDVYLNLRAREDDFLVGQRGLGPASKGREYFGWD